MNEWVIYTASASRTQKDLNFFYKQQLFQKKK